MISSLGESVRRGRRADVEGTKEHIRTLRMFNKILVLRQ